MESEGAASTSWPSFRRQSTKRDFSNMTDANRSPSPDSLFVSEDEHYHNDHTAQRPRTQTPRLALPSRTPRFAGDGLDFRRPVMSAGGASNTGSSRQTAMVIDLTDEDDSQAMDSQASSAPAAGATASSSRAQRLPRYGRSIIDMTSEGEEEWSEATSSRPNFSDLIPPPGHRSSRDPRQHHPRISLLRRPARPNSDASNMADLEFVESRPRSRPQTASRSNTPAVSAQRSVTPYPTGPHMIDLTEDDDDDVVHLDTRARPGGVNLTSPGATAGVGTRSAAERGFDLTGMLQTGSRLLQRLGNFGGAHQHAFLDDQGPAPRPAVITRQHNAPVLRFGVPAAQAAGLAIDMDYDLTGFDMGFAGANRPPTPKYEPPEPAADGFTRSPGEDEAVVCPNCGDELAMGNSEKKQEIWVIKKCGHVYCGDCAENRSKGSKKGKGKATAFDAPLPFKQCVVDGCKESASSKSMVRVYFGS